MHREPMKHVDLTGTYIKYLGSRCDFYQLGELLMMLRLRWKRLIRHATEIGQHLLRAFHQDKRVFVFLQCCLVSPGSVASLLGLFNIKHK